MTSPRISIVMPVRNEAMFIEGTLKQLLAQDYPHNQYEILVVDGESSDGTRDVVTGLTRQHPNVRLLTNPKRLSSAARNVGIKAASGEFVLIVDGHCEIDDRKMLQSTVAAFEQSNADCLGRPQPLEIPGASPLQRAVAAARSSRLGHHPDSFIYVDTARFVPAHSVAVAYRKSVFEQIGYFDERFDACEDVELNTRIDQAGLRCYFTPQIAVRYHPRQSIFGLFRQLVRYGRGRVRLMRKHPATASLGSFVPALFVLGLIVGLPLCFSSAWLAGIYYATVALYVTIVLGTSVLLALRHRDVNLLVRLPMIFLTIHVASGWGVLSEFAQLRN
jgi:succinoglycan biosynthesis protein ExoA